MIIPQAKKKIFSEIKLYEGEEEIISPLLEEDLENTPLPRDEDEDSLSVYEKNNLDEPLLNQYLPLPLVEMLTALNTLYALLKAKHVIHYFNDKTLAHLRRDIFEAGMNMYFKTYEELQCIVKRYNQKKDEETLNQDVQLLQEVINAGYSVVKLSLEMEDTVRVQGKEVLQKRLDDLKPALVTLHDKIKLVKGQPNLCKRIAGALSMLAGASLFLYGLFVPGPFPMLEMAAGAATFFVGYRFFHKGGYHHLAGKLKNLEERINKLEQYQKREIGKRLKKPGMH